MRNIIPNAPSLKIFLLTRELLAHSFQLETMHLPRGRHKHEVWPTWAKSHSFKLHGRPNVMATTVPYVRPLPIRTGVLTQDIRYSNLQNDFLGWRRLP
jgi:hypothetical protein